MVCFVRSNFRSLSLKVDGLWDRIRDIEAGTTKLMGSGLGMAPNPKGLGV